MKGHGKDRLEKATYQPGDYGRIVRPDGTEQWWVRSSGGPSVALRHQRVMPNDDGISRAMAFVIRECPRARTVVRRSRSALPHRPSPGPHTREPRPLAR